MSPMRRREKPANPIQGSDSEPTVKRDRRTLPSSGALSRLRGALGAPHLLLAVRGLTGHPGGRLVFAQRTGPQTLNPALAADFPSREIIHRIMADLIHINRESQQTEPALAHAGQADHAWATLHVRIPMAGGVDSLNIAASAAVAFYATRPADAR